MSKNTLRVYDTIAKKYVEVEVSENVRVGYNRSQWNIDDNDKSFYQHEDRKSTRLNSSHSRAYRMPSSA